MSYLVTLRKRLERDIMTDEDWLRVAPSAGLYHALTGDLPDHVRAYKPYPIDTGLWDLSGFLATTSADARCVGIILIQKWKLLLDALGETSPIMDRLLERSRETPLTEWGAGTIRAWRTRVGLPRELQIEAIRRPRKERGWKGVRVER